jgi:hypothetical protein
MIRHLAIGLAFLAWSVHAATAATSAVTSDALDAGIADETRPLVRSVISPDPAEPVTTVRVVPPPAAPVRTQSPNPLWAIPLTQLSGTRDRPIFSPSRRPPPPAVAAEPAIVKPPPRKKEIEPPPISLVGTIASEDEGFGIFLDRSTKAALRLKVGDDFQGWKLRAIRGREVAMEKDGQGAVLMLPEPGSEGTGEVRLVPASAIKTPMATQR